MLVTERFCLDPTVKAALRMQTPRFGFGPLGEAIYARTYSRTMNDGRQETWPDTVIRVVEGVGSIRKDWHVKHRLPWDEAVWQDHLRRMAFAIHSMRFLPPGRGLWAMGTDYVYERGGMALNNCAFVDVTTLSRDVAWIMNGLMAGVGVGFSTMSYTGELRQPGGESTVYVIPDDREGWVESLRRLCHSYENGSAPVHFDYSLIRPAGAPIRGFGGTASGYQPLAKLHERARSSLDAFVAGQTSRTRLIADVVNAVGACVVAGNVRRSAEIAIGSPHDVEFLNLKNYGTPEQPGPAFDRMDIGWLSNNTVRLEQHEDFKKLPELAELIRTNGEPGVMNLINVQKYARYAEESPDRATGTNPCAEIALEDKEICCLVEVFPTRCETDADYYEALELAQIYAHTASLLPTDSPETNAVVARNHRMGQSLSGIADWYETRGATEIVTMQRQGYRLVQQVNERLAAAAGVPKSVRLTTVKPSGTVSQLAGVSPGMHYPMYTTFIRRVRFGRDSRLVPLLHAAGVPSEPDVYSENTLVFEFPVATGARRTQRDLSMWQKGMMVASLQRHWADNCLPRGTRVHTTRGGIPIEQILPGDIVETPAGSAEVLTTFNQGVQETCFVNHAFGRFECTPDHPIAVFDSLFGWSFKPARCLTPRDLLVFDTHGYDGVEGCLPEFKRVSTKHNAVPVVWPELTPDLAWLVGLIQGDGGVYLARTPTTGNLKNGLIRLSFDNSHGEILDRARSLLNRFGIAWNVYDHPQAAGTCTVVQASSLDLAYWLSEHVKCGTNPLHVPSWIRNATRDIRSAYLAGLFDADGLAKHETIRPLTSVDGRFIEDVRSLYISLGMLPHIYGWKRQGHRRDAFNLVLRGEANRRTFLESVARFSSKFKDGRKSDVGRGGFTFPVALVREDLPGYRESSNARVTVESLARSTTLPTRAVPVQVLAVEPSGRSVEVFDIEVERIHQFTAEGFVVHNCVSNTITFNPKTEGHQIEDFLASIVPFTKTISMLPDTDVGAYPQMPYEPIDGAEYARRAAAMTPIDWTAFGGSDGEDSLFCASCDP